MFKFPFTSVNKLSMFIIDLSTPLFAIPSFVPLLGLFLLTVFCLVMGHIFSTWLVCSFFIGCWYWISHFRELDFVQIPSDIVRVCSQLGTSNKSHPFKVCLSDLVGGSRTGFSPGLIWPYSMLHPLGLSTLISENTNYSQPCVNSQEFFHLLISDRSP